MTMVECWRTNPVLKHLGLFHNKIGSIAIAALAAERERHQPQLPTPKTPPEEVAEMTRRWCTATQARLHFAAERGKGISRGHLCVGSDDPSMGAAMAPAKEEGKPLPQAVRTGGRSSNSQSQSGGVWTVGVGVRGVTCHNSAVSSAHQGEGTTSGNVSPPTEPVVVSDAGLDDSSDGSEAHTPIRPCRVRPVEQVVAIARTAAENTAPLTVERLKTQLQKQLRLRAADRRGDVRVSNLPSLVACFNVPSVTDRMRFLEEEGLPSTPPLTGEPPSTPPPRHPSQVSFPPRHPSQASSQRPALGEQWGNQ